VVSYSMHFLDALFNEASVSLNPKYSVWGKGVANIGTAEMLLMKIRSIKALIDRIMVSCID
jgi:hypothetical protein